MNVKMIISAVLCLVAAQVFASGKVISVLPDPVEGVYVLGSSTSDAMVAPVKVAMSFS